ncbi:MAG: SDR family oxidoreductase [Acidimicrobiales bacterium]
MADMVAGMAGKTVVVTGANTGIGLETALSLAGAGARVVITGRDEVKCKDAIAQIARRTSSESVESVTFDLSRLDSVRQGAAELLARCDRIDVLVNNAGGVMSRRIETPDGLETTFEVNHLGPFLLTQLLLDRIKASAPARIVNVASTAHRGARGGLDFDDLQSAKGYRGMDAYAKSKLANIYFTTELARRLAGTGVTVNCLHPGTVATHFGRDGDSTGVLSFGLKVIKPFVLTPEKGARTSVYLASSPEAAEVTGGYFVRRRQVQPSKAARNSEAAARLWDESEKLVAALSPG